MSNKNVDHILEELENQFHSFQDRIIKAKDDYVKTHSKEYAQAKKKVDQAKRKFESAKKRSAKAALDAKKKGSVAAQQQLVKTKAAAGVLGDALKEAKNILFTAESKLKSAKPVERKLAARAKALSAFEKAWEKKLEDEEKKKAQRKKAAASKRAAKSPAKKKAAAKKT